MIQRHFFFWLKFKLTDEMKDAISLMSLSLAAAGAESITRDRVPLLENVLRLWMGTVCTAIASRIRSLTNREPNGSDPAADDFGMFLHVPAITKTVVAEFAGAIGTLLITFLIVFETAPLIGWPTLKWYMLALAVFLPVWLLVFGILSLISKFLEWTGRRRKTPRTKRAQTILDTAENILAVFGYLVIYGPGHAIFVVAYFIGAGAMFIFFLLLAPIIAWRTVTLVASFFLILMSANWLVVHHVI